MLIFAKDICMLNTFNPITLRLLFTEELYSLKTEDPEGNLPERPVNPESVTDLSGAGIKPAEEKSGSESVIQDQAAEKPAKPSFDFSGENNKFILLLVNNSRHQYFSPEAMEALKGILDAKKQELRDVAIVNLDKYPDATFADLKDFFACSKLVLFGIPPQQIGLASINGNELAVYEDVRILATYAMEEMLADIGKKRTFWNVMKNL